jgi:hypothetical protein
LGKLDVIQNSLIIFVANRGVVAEDTYTITPVLTLIAVIPLLTLPIIMLFPKTRSNG